MPAQKIRGDYDRLKEISSIFKRQADQAAQMIRRIRGRMNTLKGGDWIGKGATAFYREMDDEVLPSLNRFQSALDLADQTTVQVSGVIKDAEDEAARLLRADGALATAVGAAVGAGVLGAAAGRAISELLAMDPNDLFERDYMRALIDSRFEGAGLRLGDAMNDLLSAPNDDAADGVLVVIAKLRGRPVDEMRAEYQKFKEVMEHRNASSAGSVKDLSDAHASFMGSNSQMRYGSIIGDCFGIDPVFGSMLNPTGGLVGPDNFAIAGDDTAIGYHGVVHDAAGYLYNFHEIGPGYDYLGVDPIPTSNPLSGQVGGAIWWKNQVGDSPVGPGIIETFVDAIDIGSWVFDGAASVF